MSEFVLTKLSKATFIVGGPLKGPLTYFLGCVAEDVMVK